MLHRSARTFLSAFALVMALPALAADTYKIDAVHSNVGFKVRHLGISTVPGQFNAFSGTVVLEPADLSKSSVTLTIDAASIYTKMDMRDNHLKTADFFDVAKYPTLTFQSTSVKKAGEGLLTVTGNFTLHGVTKTITVPATYATGPGMKPGTFIASFGSDFTIKRSEYGMTGSPVVGDEVKISLDFEAGKQ